MNMSDKIYNVLVPMEETMETKNGKKKSVMKKIFPGYVIVEMVMTDDSWYVVRNTPGVTGFVGSSGSGSKPIPLQADEVKKLLRKMGMAAAQVTIDFDINENVRVTDGPFADMIGSVQEINIDKAKLKVMVSMFGRETPVELDFAQVEKL